MKVLSAIASVLLAACSTGMSYHAWDSTWQLGYTDTQLSDTQFRVSYAGYNVPQTTCDDFALMRAAELANQKGFRYFRVLSEKQSLQSQSFYIPAPSNTTGTITATGPNTARVNATTYSSGSGVTIQRPTSTLAIELLRENTPGAIDAQIAWSSLSSKYGLTR